MADDKRHESRQRLAVPIRVTGHEADGVRWDELAETADVSSCGLAVEMQHPAYRGQVLRLRLPMPARLRRFDPNAPAYQVYAIVRDVTLGADGLRVGVMFSGKGPPRGHVENPMARMLFPSDVEEETRIQGSGGPPPRAARAKPERRNGERYEVVVGFSLERTDEFGAILSSGRGVAENVSRGGALLVTAGRYAAGDVILLRELAGAFRSRAEVRAVRPVAAAVSRLHTRFLDGRIPEHLFRKR